MDLTQTLQNLGLTEKEAKIYMALLPFSGATAYLVSQRSGLKKPTVYVVLENLVQKGFVLKMPQNKKTLYFAKPPQECISIFEEKLHEARNIIPQLTAMQKKSDQKVSVSYFEGPEGVRGVYRDTLKYGREFVAFGSENMADVLGEKWMNEFIHDRVKRNISVRAIVPQVEYYEENLLQRDKKELRTMKFINSKEFPFLVEIDIYGDSKVSLISAKESVAAIIDSTEVHSTMKSIFELLWKKLSDK